MLLIHCQHFIHKLSVLFYLSCSITKGAKQLTLPRTSISFIWNAPEVISLCLQGCLYIMARIKPSTKESSEENSEEDSEDDPVRVQVGIMVWFILQRPRLGSGGWAIDL